jgi:hypothetical protein
MRLIIGHSPRPVSAGDDALNLDARHTLDGSAGALFLDGFFDKAASGAVADGLALGIERTFKCYFNI